MESSISSSRDDDCTALWEFYRKALQTLNGAGIRFLVGGAYAVKHYTGIERETKDLDVFVLPDDQEKALSALADAGFETELSFPHWLGKAFSGDYFIDVIFSSGNGIAEVDEEWFKHALPSEVLGVSVKMIPAEEMIWSKAFIMERERYDGADIIHIFRALAEKLDWLRLIRRFGPNWRILLSHLVLFGFVYPSERMRIPNRVLQELLARLQEEMDADLPSFERVCQGTLVSRLQYRKDVEEWGYRDARLAPEGNMTREAIEHWDNGAEESGQGE